MRAGKLSALFLTTAIALTGLAGKAHALDAGDHKSFAQMEQSLRQEHQVEIARALYVMNPDDPARVKELCLKFTVNAQGDAYILISDNMDDAKAHIELVYSKLKNARLFNPGVPVTALPGVSPRSRLAEIIKMAAKDDTGVMLYGQTVRKQTDGSEKIVGTATVLASISSNTPRDIRYGVAIFFTDMNGATQLDRVGGIYVDYRGNDAAFQNGPGQGQKREP